MPTLDCSTGKAVSVFPVSQANVKNKDGNGNKRKNRGSSLSEQVNIVALKAAAQCDHFRTSYELSHVLKNDEYNFGK